MKSVIILCLWTLSAHAATAPAFDVEALAVRADQIVEGTVLQTRTVRSGGFLMTEAEIAVTACLKGTCERRVRVLSMGGRMDGVREVVMGAARFEVEEQVVLFLRALPNGPWRGRFATTGMAQGKFEIRLEGGTLKAIRNLRGVTLHGPGQLRARRDIEIEALGLRSRVADALLLPTGQP